MREEELLVTWNEVVALLDEYESLLSASQSSTLTMYYRYNLSLSEIAEEKGESRAAAFDALKKGIEKLRRYESKLGLVRKRAIVLECAEEIRHAQTLEEAKEAGAALRKEYFHGI